MAKKRKAGGRAAEASGPAELDPRDARKTIRSFEDVADSDDEFHLNEDEVRLGEAPEAKRRRKYAEQEAFLEQSDEEVLGYSEEEEEEEEDGGDLEDDEEEFAQPTAARRKGKRGNAEDADDDEDGEDYKWGTSKSDLFGKDVIETEEDALMEEAEARRLQKKHLESLRAADYGFDEAEWGQDEEKDQDDQNGATVVEVLPQLQISPDMDADEKVKLLQSRYPEFTLLSADLLKLQDAHAQLKSTRQSPLTVLKLRALSAYIGSLAMYFSLLTSPAADGSDAVAFSATKLRDHPVMADLLKCRALWLEVEPLAEIESSDVALNGHDEDDEMDVVESEEEAQIIIRQPKKSKKLSRAERHAAAARAAEEERRAERLRQTEADLADLDTLVLPSKKSKSKKSKAAGDDSDLGEEAPLSAREAADKAQRKKSLRFYTAQIAQKANKRGAAGRGAGGDDDIPYRERLKDRQARLNAEAEKRGRRDDAGADLGGESDEDDHRQAQQIRDEDDEYYDLVAARTSKKKSDKAALAEAQRQAAQQGGHVVEEETVGADGKRKISYMIEKNKGLTPHRKKDVRNPRVKKRKKYEEKKKKLASIKPVYKGGEGRGGYGGELTGIKQGLVKSTKL